MSAGREAAAAAAAAVASPPQQHLGAPPSSTGATNLGISITDVHGVNSGGGVGDSFVGLRLSIESGAGSWSDRSGQHANNNFSNSMHQHHGQQPPHLFMGSRSRTSHLALSQLGGGFSASNAAFGFENFGSPPGPGAIANPNSVGVVIPDFLFFAGEREVNVLANIQLRRISAFLAVAKEVQRPAFVQQTDIDSGAARYLHLPLTDDAATNVRHFFRRAFRYLDQCRADGHRVIVYCRAGQSRSASIVAAYLMRDQRIGYEEALERLREYRKADPNFLFCQQLNAFRRDNYNLSTSSMLSSVAVLGTSQVTVPTPGGADVANRLASAAAFFENTGHAVARTNSSNAVLARQGSAAAATANENNVSNYSSEPGSATTMGGLPPATASGNTAEQLNASAPPPLVLAVSVTPTRQQCESEDVTTGSSASIAGRSSSEQNLLRNHLQQHFQTPPGGVGAAGSGNGPLFVATPRGGKRPLPSFLQNVLMTSATVPMSQSTYVSFASMQPPLPPQQQQQHLQQQAPSHRHQGGPTSFPALFSVVQPHPDALSSQQQGGPPLQSSGPRSVTTNPLMLSDTADPQSGGGEDSEDGEVTHVACLESFNGDVERRMPSFSGPAAGVGARPPLGPRSPLPAGAGRNGGALSGARSSFAAAGAAGAAGRPPQLWGRSLHVSGMLEASLLTNPGDTVANDDDVCDGTESGAAAGNSGRANDKGGSADVDDDDDDEDELVPKVRSHATTAVFEATRTPSTSVAGAGLSVSAVDLPNMSTSSHSRAAAAARHVSPPSSSNHHHLAAAGAAPRMLPPSHRISSAPMSPADAGLAVGPAAAGQHHQQTPQQLYYSELVEIDQIDSCDFDEVRNFLDSSGIIRNGMLVPDLNEEDDEADTAPDEGPN